MATLAAKTTMNSAINYTDRHKKGLWSRFRSYLIQNQQTIIAGMALMNGNSYFSCNKILNK